MSASEPSTKGQSLGIDVITKNGSLGSKFTNIRSKEKKTVRIIDDNDNEVVEV